MARVLTPMMQGTATLHKIVRPLLADEQVRWIFGEVFGIAQSLLVRPEPSSLLLYCSCCCFACCC